MQALSLLARLSVEFDGLFDLMDAAVELSGRNFPNFRRLNFSRIPADT